MTSRQYSLFASSSARAKARREKYALTKKSLSDNWGLDENDPGSQSRVRYLGGGGGVLDLPSPTIGTPPAHLLLIPHTVSPLALFTTSAAPATSRRGHGRQPSQGGSGRTGEETSLKKIPRVSAVTLRLTVTDGKK